MKRMLLIGLVLALTVSMLAGCGSSQNAGNAGTASSAAEGQSGTAAASEALVASTDDFTIDANSKLDEDITIVQALDMVSWDPVNTSDLSNGYVINNVYSRLFTFDENLSHAQELCESFDMVSDTEWHFTIYNGVKTHDGGTLTADDVVHSLNRTKNGSAIGALFGPVQEISKVDDLTISITTNGPYPALPTALTHQATCIVPQQYSEKAEASGDWSSPVGSGRYKFESRLIGDTVKMSRFDEYFNQDDAALNKSLTFKVIPEGTSRTIAIETGSADLNVDFDTVDYDRAMANADINLWQHYSQSVWHLGMDNTNEWFSNPLVRQAINYAIDREACLEVGHNGKGTVLYNNSTIAPTCLGAINNPLDRYSYDPQKAQELMDQAGCTGFDTQIIVFRDEAERIATLCQAYLSAIGINAEVVRIENAVFASYIAEHKAPMFVTSWGAYWDPDMFLARRFTQAGIGGVNRVWYINPELDSMILEGRSTFDEDARAKTYNEIQEFMVDEAPEADLYVSVMYALAKKDLKGVEINVERPYNYYKLHY